jgi:phosphate-selective porin OprO and OprP
VKKSKGMELVLPILAALVAGVGTARAQVTAAPSDAPTVVADAQQAQATPQKATDEKKAAADATKPADPTAMQAYYKEGLVLRTADKKNEIRIQASAQLDSRFYGGDSVAPDSFDIRRARLDFNAKLQDFMTIRIQAALEDSPYIRNAFIDIGAKETFHIRIGQMKVPFSSQWLSLDNQVDFMERSTAEPLYPFFDRGLMIWGGIANKKIYYDLGVYNGSGIDADYTKGDIDDQKDVAARLFFQPFRGGSKAAEGFYFVVQGTYGAQSVPTTRYETRGLAAADFESLVWRWRTEQMLGTDGRNIDQIDGQLDNRTRYGGELTYKLGPFTTSAEWAQVKWDKIDIYHDFFQGSKLLKHNLVMSRSGKVDNASIWFSYFLTGEEKYLDNFGWRQPTPKNPWGPGLPGKGAWEVLARFATTTTDMPMFDVTKVKGYTAADFTSPAPPTPGAGNSVNAAVLDGASKVYEATVGLNWTMNYNFRVLLNYTYLWDPDYVAGKNGIVSGGNSNMWDVTVKNTLVETEQMIALRFIFRI